MPRLSPAIRSIVALVLVISTPWCYCAIGVCNCGQSSAQSAVEDSCCEGGCCTDAEDDAPASPGPTGDDCASPCCLPKLSGPDAAADLRLEADGVGIALPPAWAVDPVAGFVPTDAPLPRRLDVVRPPGQRGGRDILLTSSILRS
jgi:DNA-binding transcriptional LysR family regulator